MLIILTNQHIFGTHLFDEFIEVFLLTGFEPHKAVSHILLIGEKIVFACIAKADLVFHCSHGFVTVMFGLFDLLIKFTHNNDILVVEKIFSATPLPVMHRFDF